MSTYDRDVAIAIGHHFWHCDTDDQAEQAGRDAAIDVAKRIATVAHSYATDEPTECRRCGEVEPCSGPGVCDACLNHLRRVVPGARL